MTPQQFAQIIAIIESGNISNPPLGDGGRAIGKYQMHPDFVFGWATRLGKLPMLGETWDSFFSRLIQGYYAFRVAGGYTPIQIAMSFHRGHPMREDSPDWLADDYAARFVDAARSAGAG